jgi:protein-tyrosine sulfotransferase
MRALSGNLRVDADVAIGGAHRGVTMRPIVGDDHREIADAPGTSGAARHDLPVFIVGCHRSGTTLTRYILDAHPRLACPAESKFIAGFEAFLRYPQALTGLRCLGFKPDQVILELGRLLRFFMDRYAAGRGKARWIDKTPNYYRLLPLIDAMLANQALYVLVVRHPFDTIESLQAAPAFAAPCPEDPDIAHAVRRYGRTRAGWARHWVEVYGTASRFLSTIPTRCHSLRYEDLVTNPEPTLRELMTFLEEDLPDGLAAAAFAVDHSPGFRDWKIEATTAIHHQSVGKWRAWRKREIRQLWAIVGETARRFGYDDPAPPDPDPLSLHRCLERVTSFRRST